MKLSLYKPSNELQHIVKQYILIESLEDQENLWVLPNLGNYILFNPGLDAMLLEHSSDNISHVLPKEFCFGIKATQIVRLFVKETENIQFPMFGVELYPTGYHRLFGKEAFDLRQEHKPLAPSLSDLGCDFEALYKIEGIDEQIAYIETGLGCLLKENKSCDDLCVKIEEIIAYILENLDGVKVKDILEHFLYSRTSLERDFKKVVGYTPKEFIQTLRFYTLSKELMEKGYNYNELSYEFCDRSHMNKAFKKYTDILPSKFQDFIEEKKIKIYQNQVTRTSVDS